MSIGELFASTLHGEHDGFVGESVGYANEEPNDAWISLDMPQGLLEPVVHQIVFDGKTSEVHVIEVHEGSTHSCNVTVSGVLVVEAEAAMADAIAGAEAGLWEVPDRDVNEHYAAVLVSIPIDAEFDAIANPDYESIESLELVSAQQAG
jgi:hypothetical protein